MLHAITQKKTNIHLRYLGHREIGERRITAEDEITSLLLGPLAFMPYADIATFWQAIVNRPESWPQGEVETARMSFWEPREVPGEKRNIEADLLVDLRWADGKRITLLVELKWRSGLSSENQLHDQWRAYRSDEHLTLHLFIAPQVGEALEAKARKDIWRDCLLPISWQQILGRLAHQKNVSPGLGRLLMQMENTLKMLQIKPFTGFSKLLLPTPTPAISPIFWHGSPTSTEEL